MFNPNYLSRSERRYRSRMNVMPCIHESRPSLVPVPRSPLPSPTSVLDEMIFDMDPTQPEKSPTLAAEPLAAAPGKAAKASSRRPSATTSYISSRRPPNLSPSAPREGYQPRRRIVGFFVTEGASSFSDTERSSSGESDGNYSDLGE